MLPPRGLARDMLTLIRPAYDDRLAERAAALRSVDLQLGCAAAAADRVATGVEANLPDGVGGEGIDGMGTRVRWEGAPHAAHSSR